MKSNINYTALSISQKTLNNTIDSDVLYSVPMALKDLYDFLSEYDKLHGCFSEEVTTIEEIEEEIVAPTEEFMKLTNAVSVVIQVFQEAEYTITDKLYKNLKEQILNCFNNTSLGLFPFIYHEIEAFNDKHNCDFRIQGYTPVEDYYFITVYDKTKSYKSRIYIYDRSGKYMSYIELTTEIDDFAHLGGVTYDSDNKILFITGKKGQVNSYDYRDIESLMKQTKEYSGKSGTIPDESVLLPISMGSVNIASHITDGTSAATVYYDNNGKSLYVADCAKSGTLIKYQVSYQNGKVSYDSGKVVSKDFAACCQGIATYQDNRGNNYIYATQSFGKNNPSVIKKYEVTNTGLKEVGSTIIDTPGLEGIEIDNQGNVSGVFENFQNTNNPNKTLNMNVNTTDFSKTLKERNPELEATYQLEGLKNKNKVKK